MADVEGLSLSFSLSVWMPLVTPPDNSIYILAREFRLEKQSNTWIPIWDSINRIIASGILESLFISFGEVECSIFVQFIKQYHFTSPRVLLVSGNRMPYTVNGIFIPNVTLVVSALLQPFLPYFFLIKTFVFIWSLRLKDYT